MSGERASTLVLGLDGASFELLDPWIEAGHLPTLTRLKEEEVATDMDSVLPPVTCPNWQAYATGTNPGKLGVYWWERVDADAREIVPTNGSHDFNGHHYWAFLGGDAAVLNLPTTYPPSDIDGVLVAGGPGAEQTGYTAPTDLEGRLEAEFDYAVHPAHLGALSGEDPDGECVEEILDLADARFDVLESMLATGEYEICHLTVFYVNVLQHFFWDGEPTRRAWELIDRRIGDLLEADVTDRVVLMSDHGSMPIEVSFRINAWLEREGYLVTGSGVGDYLHRIGLTRERVRPVLSGLGIEWALRRIVPRRVQTMLPAADGSVTEAAKASAIDWEASMAVASGQGPLYVIADDPDENRQVREELRDRLDGLTHEGTTIVEGVYAAEDIYEGPYLDRAPDLVLSQGRGVHIEESLGGEGEVFAAPTTWRGENKDTGFFAATGVDVDPTASPGDMHILDIAPTILHAHGQPVPSHMDGRVRTELFAEGSEPAERTVETVETAGPAGADDTERVPPNVNDRLGDLGYLQ